MKLRSIIYIHTHTHTHIYIYIYNITKGVKLLFENHTYSKVVFDSRYDQNWCFWTVVLEKSLQSPLDCKEIQPVHPKGDQSWVFIGRTDAEAETLILWPPDEKSWLIGKDPDAGRDWGQEEKGTTEDEMAGWHYQLDGHEFEWTQGVGDEQGSLVCCNSWGRKESDTPEQLNWTDDQFKADTSISGLILYG